MKLIAKPIFILFLMILIVCCWLVSTPRPAYAQTADRVGLTIAPPLVKNSLEPGETWASSIKVVNNGTNTIDVYAQAIDFTSNENGGPELIQAGGNSAFSLKEWIKIEPGPYPIPAQESIEIPYVIRLPAEAGPGGHYAAVMIGTRPIDDISGTGMKISSMLASLLMVKVKGEIDERGQILEFSTEKTVYTEPQIRFAMKFENTGNVDIQPQGEIKIFDWLGKEKGKISINQKSDFGNVLPDSVRKWSFDWSETRKLSSMGKYKADLILGYGSQARQTANQTICFWIIYPKPIIIGLVAISLTFLFIFLILKLYIRRAIINTTKAAGLTLPVATPITAKKAASKPLPTPLIRPKTIIRKPANNQPQIDLRKGR